MLSISCDRVFCIISCGMVTGLQTVISSHLQSTSALVPRTSLSKLGLNNACSRQSFDLALGFAIAQSRDKVRQVLLPPVLL